MAKGTAVRDFIVRLRERFNELLGDTSYEDEMRVSDVRLDFERAINDTFIGTSEPKQPARTGLSPQQKAARTRKKNRQAQANGAAGAGTDSGSEAGAA